MFGVYVHFPYCVRRCPYCDFATSVVDEVPHDAYADAVLAELDWRLANEEWPRREVRSIYFGGGTPSLWRPEAFARVLRGLRGKLAVADDAEVTVEANPGAAESGTLASLREAGANRVSFGAQSFHPQTLEALGRWHRASDSDVAVASGRAAGFDDISLDLIYAVPGQSPEEAAADVERAADAGADHVSAYALTLEAHVPMAVEVAAGRVRLPDDEEALAIEDAVLASLERAGFERYEISNHARGGRRSAHNTLYWRGGEYLGLGAAAAGFRRTGPGGVRYSNVRGEVRYRQRAGSGPTSSEERVDARTRAGERMFLGLRLAEGVDLAEVAADTGVDVETVFEEALSASAAEGWLTRDGSRVRPTTRGFRFHDLLSMRFV